MIWTELAEERDDEGKLNGRKSDCALGDLNLYSVLRLDSVEVFRSNRKKFQEMRLLGQK